MLYHQNLMLFDLFRGDWGNSVRFQMLAVGFVDVEKLGLNVGLGMALLSMLRN